MSRAIKCNRCGKFEAVDANVEFVDDLGVKLMTLPMSLLQLHLRLPNRDLCSSCALELTNWWTYPRLYSVKSVEPLTESIDEYVSDGKVFTSSKSKIKELQETINANIRKGKDPSKAVKEAIGNIVGDPSLSDDWKYSPIIPMSLPDDTDEGLKLETKENEANKPATNDDTLSKPYDKKSSEGLKLETKENEANKPATNDDTLSKPYDKKSSTNIKWDDYNVDKMMKMIEDGMSLYEIAAKFRTTIGSISGILSVIRHSKPGHWHHQYRLKYKKYFEQDGRQSVGKKRQKKWSDDDVRLVIEYKKDGKTYKEIADIFHTTSNAILGIVNRTRHALECDCDPLYPIAKEYESYFASEKGRAAWKPRWNNEDEIRKMFEARATGMSWNDIAKEFNITRPDLHSFQTGLSGNNSLICSIAKEYGYGD